MPRTINTENPAKDVRRYLKHWGNASFVEGELQARHTGLSPDLRRRKARTVALSILQGLEFFESAEDASLLARPLPLFYAVENITKAVCIFNDPRLEEADFRAHGLRGDRSRRYSIKNLECKIGRPGSDVWSRAFALVNADVLRFEMLQDGLGVIRDDRMQYATVRLAAGTSLKLGELLRHLPELAHDVIVADWGHPFAVHVVQFALEVTTGPPASNQLRFMLRHAHHAPTRRMIINRETDLLRGYSRLRDTLDVVEYQIGPTPNSITAPRMHCDIFGALHMDFARGRVVLSECILYLAALFILSDVVRYQVDQWSRLLEDHPAEAILIERFLDLAPRKFPNLVLNELHREFFLFKVGA